MAGATLLLSEGRLDERGNAVRKCRLHLHRADGFFEYAYDVIGLAHDAGLASVFVANGYISIALTQFQR